MTIEELASQQTNANYTIGAQRTYDNIRQMRNAALMRGFLCRKNENTAKKIATVGGIDYIDATQVGNLNSAWLLFEKITKNIIWILDSEGVSEREIKKISNTLNGKIKKIILTSDKEEDILQSVLFASGIASNDDCVVFTSFDSNPQSKHRKAEIYSQTVFSM